MNDPNQDSGQHDEFDRPTDEDLDEFDDRIGDVFADPKVDIVRHDAISLDDFRDDHKLLESDRMAVAKQLRFRIAGTDRDTGRYSSEGVCRDAMAIRVLDQDISLRPAQIELQLATLRSMYEEAGYDWLRAARDADENTNNFLTQGGQVRPIEIQEITDVIRRGFALMLEYSDPDTMEPDPSDPSGQRRNPVWYPVGYHFGFTSLPHSKPDKKAYPSLAAQSLIGKSTYLDPVQKKPEDTYVIWRTGVVQNISNVRESLQTLGFSVPRGHTYLSFRRLGASTATKYISGTVAERLGKKRVICNIGNLTPVGGMEYAVPNVASLGANAPLFRRSRLERDYHDVLSYEQGDVAWMEWDVYMNDPAELVERTRRTDSALTKKQGIDVRHLDDVSDQLYEMILRRGSAS